MSASAPPTRCAARGQRRSAHARLVVRVVRACGRPAPSHHLRGGCAFPEEWRRHGMLHVCMQGHELDWDLKALEGLAGYFDVVQGGEKERVRRREGLSARVRLRGHGQVRIQCTKVQEECFLELRLGGNILGTERSLLAALAVAGEGAKHGLRGCLGCLNSRKAAQRQRISLIEEGSDATGVGDDVSAVDEAWHLALVVIEQPRRLGIWRVRVHVDGQALGASS